MTTEIRELCVIYPDFQNDFNKVSHEKIYSWYHSPWHRKLNMLKGYGLVDRLKTACDFKQESI